MWKQVNCLMPKLTVLISTFHIEGMIKFIIHINAPHLLLRIWKDGVKFKESTGGHRQTKHSRTLLSLLFTTDKPDKHTDSGSVALSAFVPSICCSSAFDLTETKPMSYLYAPARWLFTFIPFSGRQSKKAGLDCHSAYVSYGARPAAVVSPQSVGREASSALLRCYATRAWPVPGSAGC